MFESRLPIGVDDFKKVCQDHRAWVDKSLFIKEIIDDPSEVLVITRPRRFGKSFNLSMLGAYFDCHLGQERQAWFEPLAISRCGSTYTQEMGQYPVIMISLKSAEQTELGDAVNFLAKTLEQWVLRNDYLLSSSKLHDLEKKWLLRLIDHELSRVDIQTSLSQLTHCVSKHWGKTVILLIDEYDAPIHSAYQHGYYDQMITFFRGWLGDGLKSNPCLKRGVLTGVLRLSKESLFSGLNSVSVHGVLQARFSAHFGFTQSEVDSLLSAAGYEDMREQVRCWYNGYRMGEHQLYNPWSMVHFIYNGGNFQPYWVNSSDNILIRGLLARAGSDTKVDFEALLQGQSVAHHLSERIHFGQLAFNDDALWTLLVASGYLTLASPSNQNPYQLCIPNCEVMSLFSQLFPQWFTDLMGYSHFEHLLRALTIGDVPQLQESLSVLCQQTLSFFDVSGTQPERVYHAFVLGMSAALESRYCVKSNQESGLGRYDVMLIPRKEHVRGVVIEFKCAKANQTLEDAAEDALLQIQQKNYAASLEQAGHSDPIFWGIAFQGKQVAVLGKS